MLPQLNWLTGLQEYSVFCFHKVLYWIIHVFDYLKVLLTISSNILKIKNKVFRIMHTIKISLIKQSNLQSFVNIRIKMWRKTKNTIIGETYLMLSTSTWSTALSLSDTWTSSRKDMMLRSLSSDSKFSFWPRPSLGRPSSCSLSAVSWLLFSNSLSISSTAHIKWHSILFYQWNQ